MIAVELQLPLSPTRHCATSKFKQGIGIIFIRIFFATCFAHFPGPIGITITLHDEYRVKKTFLFRNMRKEKRLQALVIDACSAVKRELRLRFLQVRDHIHQ